MGMMWMTACLKEYDRQTDPYLELSPWAKTFVESSEEMVKARRRVNLEPEWRFNRPTDVAVGDDGKILVVESHSTASQLIA